MEDSKKIVDLLSETVTILKGIAQGSGLKFADGRFIDNGGKTITDKKTSLMWAKDDSEKEINFADAEKYCKELNLDGHNDWRLPTVEELLNLVDYTKSEPAINSIFNCKKSWFWTSTPFAGDAGNAWIVNFYSGRTGWHYRTSFYYVRPVRQISN